MAKNVESFVYTLLTDVFNAADTADILISQILEAKDHYPGNKTKKIETKADWSREKIIKKAANIISDKGPDGDFDD